MEFSRQPCFQFHFCTCLIAVKAWYYSKKRTNQLYSNVQYNEIQQKNRSRSRYLQLYRCLYMARFLFSFSMCLCSYDSRGRPSPLCNKWSWPNLPHEQYVVQRRLARSQWRHHQLRQLPVCYADGVPVHHYGGLDRRALLGQSHHCLLYFILVVLFSDNYK